MAHAHSHSHPHAHGNNHALSLAFWLNLIFSIIELIGGYLTNSTAIMMDALHDFTDAMSIGLAVLLEKWSGKPASKQFSFGYQRFSLLSALLMSGLLLAGSMMMINNAIGALQNPKTVHSQGMFWLAVLGVLINGFAVFKISSANHNDEHSHNHEHKHSDNHRQKTTNKQSQNSKAIMLHLFEDLLGWLAVLVGAVVIYFTDWFWIDSVLAILIALYVGYHAFTNLLATMKILLMAVPDDIDMEQLTADILAISEVQAVDKLRVWSLDGMENVASVHIQVQHKLLNNDHHTDSEDRLMVQIQQLFHNYGIDDLTVQQLHLGSSL